MTGDEVHSRGTEQRGRDRVTDQRRQQRPLLAQLAAPA